MESLDFWNELVSFVGRHPIISLLWAITLGYTVYYQIVIWRDGLKLLNSKNAIEMYNHDKAVLVDVRDIGEYSNGHLAGSVSVSSKDLLELKFSQVERFKDKTVVVVGQHAKRKTELSAHLLKCIVLDDAELLISKFKLFKYRAYLCRVDIYLIADLIDLFELVEDRCLQVLAVLTLHKGLII